MLTEVDRAAEEIVDFAARLIRIPTVNPPGEEYEACANAIGDQLRAHGQDVQLLPAIGRKEHTPQHPRINVIGSQAGSANGPAIHLNGHFDVVPTGTAGRAIRLAAKCSTASSTAAAPAT